jgi:hypothetical protein
METAAYLIGIVIIASASHIGIKWLVRACSSYRGTKIVTCPETGRPAIVEVDALHASLTSTVSPPDIRLENCWRWPLKEQCGQECLATMDVAPSQCLISGVLIRWYPGKICVYCGKRFEGLHWTDHKPAFRSPEGWLLRWSDNSLQNLPMVLETNRPVCWDCYIVQTFRREHPELVVYRSAVE